MEISFEWNSVWLLFCVGFALVCTLLLYFKSTFKEFKTLFLFLQSFRFLTLFILAFFLLKPIINKVVLELEEPIVIIAVDNSSSMISSKDSLYYKTEFLSQMNLLKSKLAKDFDLDFFTFGQEITENGNISFSEKKTDFSILFQELSDVYSNRNVAGVVVVSDGINNTGLNPLFLNNEVNAPFFYVATGDTSQKKDVFINTIFHNDIAYLENNFPVEVSLCAQNAKFEKVNVKVLEKEKLLYEKTIEISSDDFVLNVPFFLFADEIGLHHYTVELETSLSSENTSNNIQHFYIDILESKQKILFLYDHIHPDISAITSALDQNSNYELELFKIDDFDGNYNPYSMLIAYQTYPKDVNIPCFYFVGDYMNSLNLEWINLNSSSAILEDANAIMNNFSFFELNDEWNKFLSQTPPLKVPFSNVNIRSDFQTLFHQNIKGINTEKPILIFSKSNSSRQAIFLGEGLWRWRMQDFKLHQNHNLFDELINKSIQFLVLKEDKEQFRIKSNKRFDEGDNIVFQAELYNSSYELVNDPEVFIQITDRENTKFDYVFNKNNKSYIINIEDLNEGDYLYEAKVNFEDKMFIKKGTFSITSVLIEQYQSRANHQLLINLAQFNNSQLVYPSNLISISSILNELPTDTYSYSREIQTDLIHNKWISYLLFVFLFFEWYLRKLNGNI